MTVMPSVPRIKRLGDVARVAEIGGDERGIVPAAVSVEDEDHRDADAAAAAGRVGDCEGSG